MRRDDDDAQAGRTCLQFFQEPDAIHLVHAQVGDDEVGCEAAQRRQCLGGAFDGLDLVALGTQPYRQQPEEARIVVYKKDFALWTSVFVRHGFDNNLGTPRVD